MKEKRYLNENELNEIRVQHDLLNGNINRMCVCDNSDELLEMYRFANIRIKLIYDLCSNKFFDDNY